MKTRDEESPCMKCGWSEIYDEECQEDCAVYRKWREKHELVEEQNAEWFICLYTDSHCMGCDALDRIK
jgi:hypothetical protein